MKRFIVIRVLNESLAQAVQQLISNKLRSFLTLLGITIGIFCVISVLAAVDSLEDNIMKSFDKLGTDVIYVSKQPWNEHPGQNYWKYMARPVLAREELRAIQKKSKLAEAAALAVFMPGSKMKSEFNEIEGVYYAGITNDYDEVFKMELQEGRIFSETEFNAGSDQIILGADLAESLFEGHSAVGQRIKVLGQYMFVCGVLKKEGKSIIKVMPTDNAAYLPWNTITKFISIKGGSNWGTNLSVKAKRGVDLDELSREIAGILRPVRGLSPRDKDNFSVNQITLLTNLTDQIFGVINTAGFMIGMFAMLVGAFGVANIMFVSVKERTHFIGIKMALGAKRIYILLEYLLEAIILCIMGALIGLFLVWLIMIVLGKMMGYEMYVSMQNILTGLFLAVIIGIIAGIAPALQAARMDPVEAIRK